MSHLFSFVTPWNMDDLSPSELDQMTRALDRQAREAKRGGRRRG